MLRPIDKGAISRVISLAFVVNIMAQYSRDSIFRGGEDFFFTMWIITRRVKIFLVV